MPVCTDPVTEMKMIVLYDAVTEAKRSYVNGLNSATGYNITIIIIIFTIYHIL